jgi:hypothetical protein
MRRGSKEENAQHSIYEGGEVRGEITPKGEGETNLKYGVEKFLMVVINSGAVEKKGAASTWSMPSNKR